MLSLCMCALFAVSAIGVSYIPVLEQLKHFRDVQMLMHVNCCPVHCDEATTASREHVHFRDVHLLMHVTLVTQ
jgi:hypothetical protein